MNIIWYQDQAAYDGKRILAIYNDDAVTDAFENHFADILQHRPVDSTKTGYPAIYIAIGTQNYLIAPYQSIAS